MDTLFQDLRYGTRTLLKSPGFTAVAILSLALGIGANTAIFSVVNAVLLRPLPYKNPDQLMQVFLESENPKGGLESSALWSYPKFQALRDSSEAFEQVAAVSDQNFPLTDTDSPERLNVEMVSASYFPMLGVEAATGRTFLDEEDKTPGTHPVAVIGHALWVRRFGSDPDIIGRTISLNKIPLTIVGVLPEGFKGQKATAEVWVPMMMAPQLTFARRLQAPFAHWTEVIARLKPGVSFAQAQGEMGIVAGKMREAIPMTPQMAASMPPESIKLTALKEAKLDPAISKSFLILFAAVGFVLLIACVNIANLMMARGLSRQKEIAVRMALGASRGRLIRQLLTESVLLAVLGGVVGLLVSLWGVEFLSAFKPAAGKGNSYAQVLDFSKANIDAQVLAFNALLSVVTGVLFGLLPAIQASRPDVNEALKEGTGIAGTRHRSYLHGFVHLGPRNLLVVTEIALALVLLIGAGLMIRSFARLQALPTGFSPDHLMTMRVQLPKYKPGDAARFNEQLLGRISNLPGVEAATVASSTPLSNNSSGTVMTIKDQPDAGASGVGIHSIGPDYFKALRIPVLAGRAFTDQDRAGSPRVVIINEAAARKFWPDQDAIGKQVWLGVGWEQNEFGEIVGVAGDVKYGKVEEAFEPQVYVPYLQPTEDASFVIARTANDPAKIVAALRQEVIALDKNVPVYDVKTMQERSADATSRTRFSAVLLGTFASLALALSAIGIYGVMSYRVSGRTREIGVRMALGASSRNVLGLVLRDGVVITLAGVALGLCGALAATRVLASQLYGVETTDTETFAVVSLLLAAVALAACYVPARRATKVDPMVALRYE
ncbi:MAG TPA: ABC transporter permease [Blastocatellia bacterium]|nr:ABC transporter permease [Blastocatellia bacterium]